VRWQVFFHVYLRYFGSVISIFGFLDFTIIGFHVISFFSFTVLSRFVLRPTENKISITALQMQLFVSY